MHRKRKQAGQVLILVVLGLTAMMGVMVVAIDAAMLYLDRRQLQNAADAAALVGADVLQTLSLGTYTPAHQAAITAVVNNTQPYTSDPGTCSTSCPGATVPSSGFLSIGNGYSIQLKVTAWNTYYVTVTHTHQFALASFLGFNTTQVVAASAKALSSTYPFAVVVLKNDSLNYEDFAVNGTPGGLTLSGGNGTGHGGMFSNESINPGTGSIVFANCGTNGDLWAYAESITGAKNVGKSTTGWEGAVANPTCPLVKSGGPLPYPRVASSQLPMPNYPEQLPPASAPTFSTAITITSGKAEYLCPGNYTAPVTVNSGGLIILMPGIYRFSGGGGLSDSGTLRTAVAGDFPYPLAGYVVSTNCSSTPTNPTDPGVVVEIAPGSACSTNLFFEAGTGSLTLYPSPKYNNISVYVEFATPSPWQTTCSTTPEGTNVVSIKGGAMYNIYGVLYGPGDNMNIGGGPAGSGVGQVAAWTLTCSGNSAVNEAYDPTYLPYFRGLIQ